MKAGRKAKTQLWRLAKLKDHPMQAAIFGDLPEAEFEAFVADVRQKGLRVPPEILPDGTIVTGHQRVRAARRLGWKEIEVVVRHDLAEAGAKAVLELFLADNLRRRQLGPLARARCIVQLIENEAGRPVKDLRWNEREAMKETIGKQLGISTRSVRRYLLVLGAPASVQNAFDRGELTLAEAGKVALLDRAGRAEVDRRIAAGEAPRAAVAGRLARPTGRHRKVHDAVRSLARALDRGLGDLDGRLGEVRPSHVVNNVNMFKRAAAVLDQLLALGGP